MSPLPSSLEIKGARNVKRYDGYPYFSVLAGATQWCIYGSFGAYSNRDPTLLTMVAANGPGIFLGIFYITTYLYFVPADDCRCAALKRYLKFGAVLLLAEIIGCVVLGHGAVFWLGLLGSIGSAQIALSPFKTLPEVLRNRSTRSWPLDLCLWNFIQSAATGGFGVANSDPWVWVPNAIGVVAAVIQLSFIVAYREGSTRSVSTLKLPRSTVI
jgi:solute carrier family 50 protein (sugar transporter)